jgi:SAM-dependent methyltransferase
MLKRVSTALSDILACPVCYAELGIGSGGLTCRSCARFYPFEGDVPNFVLAPPDGGSDRPPGLAGRALESLVATPFIYDLVQRLAGAEQIFRRLRTILAEAEGADVLDAGAGTGSYEAVLPRSARYIWLDPDSQKLAGFRTKSSSTAVLGDATRMPLKDGSVDWALSIGVSHHLDDEQLTRMLDEIRRVVRSRFLFLDPVVTPRFASRALWHYDRGRHPRTAGDLRRQLSERFDLLADQEFTILHRYLLVTAI